MKLNNSPSGTPSWRKRLAISEWALSFMTSLARLPSTLAGDKRKILCGPDCEPDFLSPQPLTRLARSHASLPIFAFEDHICRVSDIIQRGLILDSIGEMPDLRQVGLSARPAAPFRGSGVARATQILRRLAATAVSQKLGGLLQTTLRGPRVCAPVSRPLHPPRRHLQPSTGLVGRRPSHLSLAGLG